MYWPASGKTAGYEKGKYSLALPAGVACIGLISLIIGMIISIGFPTVVVEWTKGHACILGPWQKEYANWVNDTERRVTVSIRLWNLTNAEQFLFSGMDPEVHYLFSLTEPLTFHERNKRLKVSFNPGEVSFTKSATYSYDNVTKTKDDAQCSAYDNNTSLWLYHPLFQKFDNVTKVLKYFHAVAAKLNDTFQILDTPMIRIESWLISMFHGNCLNITTTNQSTRNYILQICQLFQIPFDNLALSKRSRPIAVAISLIEELMTLNQTSHMIVSNQQCSKLCQQFTTGLQVLVLYHFCKTQNVIQILAACDYGNETTINHFGETEREQTKMLELMDRLMFTTLTVFLNIQIGTKKFVPLTKTSAINFLLDTESNSGTNFLGSIFGDASPSKLDLCQDKWNLDSSTVFRWLESNGYPFSKNPYSEYALPPMEPICPCLSPSPQKLYTVLFDGLQLPVYFLYNRTTKIDSETIHVYDKINIGPIEEIKLNVPYSIPLIITPICSNSYGQILPKICSNITNIQSQTIEFGVEPVTAAIWYFDINYQINVRLPKEFFVLYNISDTYKNQLFPLMWIQRTSQVNSNGQQFFKNTIKPFLMAVCGGTVVFNTLAICLVLLAVYLAIRLYWKPLKSHRFEASLENLDFQQLNTVKLRKLLGN